MTDLYNKEPSRECVKDCGVFIDHDILFNFTESPLTYIKCANFYPLSIYNTSMVEHSKNWYFRVQEIAYEFGGPSEKNVSPH